MHQCNEIFAKERLSMKKKKSIIMFVLCLVISANIPISALAYDYLPKMYDKEWNEVENITAIAKSSNSRSGIEKESTAVLRMNSQLTQAEVCLKLNGNTYNFQVNGAAEKIGKGYQGIYQGVLAIEKSDKSLLDSVPDGRDNALVNLDVTIANDALFFTMVIGVISEDTTPIVKSYGEYTEEIRQINKIYMQKVESEKLVESGSSNLTATPRIDATIKYKAGITIYDNANRSLGSLSLFHASELGNQNSMSVFAKVNSNRSNANTYARNYFGLNSNHVSVAYPTRVNVALNANDPVLHVDGENYSPKNSKQTITVNIPYVVGNKVEFYPYSMLVSSISASTSGTGIYNNQRISWSILKPNGIGDMDGSYASQKGLTTSASYKYEGNISSNKTATITLSGTITYTIFVEDSINETTTSYSFTTANNRWCTGMVTILP